MFLLYIIDFALVYEFGIMALSDDNQKLSWLPSNITKALVP